MKKKPIIFIALTGVTVVGTLATAIAFDNSKFGIKNAKATDKEFVFNSEVGAAQFEQSSAVVTKNVTTNVSDPIVTNISLTEDTTERDKRFGEDGYFVQKNGGLTAALFTVTIGVNNCTAVNVKYGSTYASNDDTIVAKIVTKDGEGNQVDEASQTLTENYSTGDLSWAREAGDAKVEEIVITVKSNKFIYWGYNFFIQEITLNWSC